MKTETLTRIVGNLNQLMEICKSIQRFSGASTVNYKILAFHENSVDVKIENWNNRYFTIEFDKPMISIMLSTIREYKEYVEYCLLLKKARKENAVLHDGELVYIKNENVEDRTFHRQRAEYVIQSNGEYRGTWYGFNAENALDNAAPYLKDQPTTIALKKVA